MFASTASETPETSLPQVRPNTSTSKVTINRPPSWNRRKQSSPSESNDSESKLKSEFVAEEEEPMGGARIRRGSVSMVLLPTSGQNQRSESIMKITWFNALSAKSTRTSSEEQESPTASDVRRSGPGNGLDKDEGNTTDKPPSEVNARLPLIKPRFAFNDKAIQSTVDINDLGRQRSTLQVKPVVPLDSSLESSQLTNSLPSVSSQSQRSIYTASTSNNRRPHGSGLEGGQRDTSGSGSRIEHRRSHTQRSSGTSSVDRRTSYSSNDNTAGFYEGDKNIHSIAENPDERSVNGDGSSTHKRLRRENSTPAMSMKSRPRKDSYYAVASAERARKLAASKRKLSMELEEIRYANLLATIPKVASVVELDDVP
ncbi:hypothetical protein HK102_005607 [Quaeritorhiza haematococci]|nr:hypothetical protein HK102_005607 [Quaeritorhiza haematococci]